MSRIWDQLQFIAPGWGDLVEILIVAVSVPTLLWVWPL